MRYGYGDADERDKRRITRCTLFNGTLMHPLYMGRSSKKVVLFLRACLWRDKLKDMMIVTY